MYGLYKDYIPLFCTRNQYDMLELRLALAVPRGMPGVQNSV